MAGIAHDGDSAEDYFCSLTGAIKTKRGDPRGDAELDGQFVEVKKASSNTVNQVRAVKYLPLVVYNPDDGTWYVVPAHQVVKLVSQKTRGQHTENPFESATLTVKSIQAFATAEPEVKSRTLSAVAEAEKFPELRDAMAKVLVDSKDLAVASVSYVRALIEQETRLR